jgi:hypothetical protein
MARFLTKPSSILEGDPGMANSLVDAGKRLQVGCIISVIVATLLIQEEGK